MANTHDKEIGCFVPRPSKKYPEQIAHRHVLDDMYGLVFIRSRIDGKAHSNMTMRVYNPEDNRLWKAVPYCNCSNYPVVVLK